MEIFQFLWGALAWMVSIAAFFPLNIPMAALAFRVWRETKESEIEGSELWIRSALTSAILAVTCVGFVAADFLLAGLAEFPPGPIHLVIIVGFVALASWEVLYPFSIEDYFQGLSLVLIYLLIPIIVLFLLNGLLGLINESLQFWSNGPVMWAKIWLKEPVP